MSDKQEMLNYFEQCRLQAEFDGDGNAEAMFAGLKADAVSVVPDSAFFLRPTFLDGSEQAQRRIDNAPPETPPETPPTETTAPVTEPVGSISSGGSDPVPAGTPPGPADAAADPALTAAAHEASQDAEIAKLKEDAAEMAKKFSSR